MVGLLVLAWVATPSRVVAAWDPVGEASGFVLLEPAAEPLRFGGGGLVDLLAPVDAGLFQIGMVAGIGAISSSAEAETQSGLLLPLGASLALDPLQDAPVGVVVRARVGALVMGDDGGFGLGAWVSGGLALGVRIDPRLRVTVGADVWGVFEQNAARRYFVTPTIGLRWVPEPEPEPYEPEPYEPDAPASYESEPGDEAAP